MARENDITKKGYAKARYNEEHVAELAKCMIDPLYFAEKYVMIQHPIYGRVPFNPYPYQRRIIKAFHEHRNCICLCGRQMGKTTCAAVFMLWKAMFEPDSTILIAANKFVQALEIMERVRFAYQNLEHYNWLRAGVTEYNKGTIAFDNGSRIISRATSPDAGRGLSISLLYVDEFSYIHPSIASNFWSALQPTLSTGGSCIITSTPNNNEDQFAQIWHGAIDTYDEFGNERENGVGSNGFYGLKVTYEEHPERDGKWAIANRQQLGDERFRREFQCCAHNTNLDLQEQTGVISKMTIGDLYDKLAPLDKK